MKPTTVLGGAVGLLAAGAAVGLATGRYAIGRIRAGPDPEAGEPFGRLPADRTRVVVADDGVPLYVEEVGPADAPLAIVLVHGYALSMGAWHYQRRALAGPARRLVLYDQRGHGRSGRGEPLGATIEQLGRDLADVLDGVDQPAVLIGHSMGGMAIMGLAAERPERFGERIRGVALLSTSAGMISKRRLSVPAGFRRLAVAVVAGGLTHGPRLVERGWRAGADIAWLLTRRYGFGSGEVSPAVVGYAERLIEATPPEVIGEFLPIVMAHDKRNALPALRGVPALVIVGERDALTPVEHSQAIAAALPRSDLRIVTSAGHLAMMERPAEVNAALREFLGAWR